MARKIPVGKRTLYELIAEHPSGAKLLVAYASGKGRQDLWRCVTAAHRVHNMIALTGDQEIHFAKLARDGGRMGAWKIYFTGETQRDAVNRSSGEFPYVGEAENVKKFAACAA